MAAAEPKYNWVFFFPTLSQASRDTELDRERCLQVINCLKNHVKNRRPARIVNKWHLWKYVESERRKNEFAFNWLDQGNSTREEVGWGRRIYEKKEIEVQAYCVCFSFSNLSLVIKGIVIVLTMEIISQLCNFSLLSER